METIHNFRDFGGYQTQYGMTMKKGMLYRSGSLAGASDGDLERLSTLGIRTIIDLRTTKERSRKPDLISEGSSIQYIHLPIKVKQHNEAGFLGQLFYQILGKGRKLDYFEVSKAMYAEYVKSFRTVYSRVLKLTADMGNLPILIHCAAGKDRTGFAASLIQRIAGVSSDLIMEEYLLSNTYAELLKEEMLEKLGFLSSFGISSQKFAPLFEVNGEYLETAYRQIVQDYGTFDAYINDGLKFSEDVRTRMNANLLE